MRCFLYRDAEATLMPAALGFSLLALLLEQNETAAMIDDPAVLHSHSRVCIYTVCADPERDIIIGTVTQDPNGRGTAA